MSKKPLKTCEVCGKKVVNIWGHINTHKKDKPHKCSFCPKGFNYKSDLTRHFRSHTLETPFKCDACGKAFSLKHHLTQHTKSVHNKVKDLVCTFCNMNVSKQSGLQDHLLRHIQEKPFPCELCGASFCTSGDRERHVRTHTLERIFKCQKCKKSFAHKSTLLYHEKTHLKERPRLFKCSICDATFTDNKVLQKHKSVHDTARKCQCQKCSKDYKTAQNLKYHDIVVHQKVKPRHFCVFCLKGFHTQAALFEHTFSHTFEKPFFCRECDISFSHFSSRNRHVRRCHRTVVGG